MIRHSRSRFSLLLVRCRGSRSLCGRSALEGDDRCRRIDIATSSLPKKRVVYRYGQCDANDKDVSRVTDLRRYNLVRVSELSSLLSLRDRDLHPQNKGHRYIAQAFDDGQVTLGDVQQQVWVSMLSIRTILSRLMEDRRAYWLLSMLFRRPDHRGQPRAGYGPWFRGKRGAPEGL